MRGETVSVLVVDLSEDLGFIAFRDLDLNRGSGHREPYFLDSCTIIRRQSDDLRGSLVCDPDAQLMLNGGVCMRVKGKAEDADQAACRVGLLPDSRSLKLVFVCGVVEWKSGTGRQVNEF